MSSPNTSADSWGHERASRIFQFGPFVLDTGRQLLTKDEQPVTLTPKTYDTLLVLVESRGRLLTKEELMKALWPDSFVEESNLTQQISMIRKALGDSPGDARYIVTVSGRGYRFAAEVKESPTQSTEIRPASIDRETKDPALAPAFEEKGAERKSGRWVYPLVGVLFAIVLIALGYSFYSKQPATTTQPAAPRSLAILPFRNLKADANSDFLGFSLADAVVTKLSYVSGLTVRPSSAVEKYRNQDIDLQKVAADLNVDTLLTGNFIHEGDDLRITCELIDVRTKRMLWKSALDLKYKKLLTVQDDVAQHVVDNLELSLSPAEAEHLKADQPKDPLAYEYYLRGVDLYSRSDFPLAIRMLEKSAELNPNYAPTWANLGKAYGATASFQFGGREQYRKAETAYQRALSLHPGHIDTRIYMANMFTDTGRVEQGVPLLREALKENPNHAEAHWELGYAYRFAGNLQESVNESERARQLDPGVKLNSSMPNSYLYLGRYDKFLQSLPKNDDLSLVVFYRGFGEYHLGDMSRAEKDFDRAFELEPSLLHAQVGKALSYGIKNKAPEGLRLLRQAEEKISERGVTDPEAIYKVGQAYAMLGDSVSALRVVRQSVEGGFFPSSYIANDPLLRSVRSEGEFKSILEKARQRHETFSATFF